MIDRARGASPSWTLTHPDVPHSVTIIGYGAHIVSVRAPDRDGVLDEVTLGYVDAASYRSDANPYMGATVGRVANRITHGRLTIEGQDYALACNAPPHHLHGGVGGFSRAEWQPTSVETSVITLAHTSPTGSDGYPGEVAATMRVALSPALGIQNGAAIDIEYEAVTDVATPINVANHVYWNLAGAEATQTIAEHQVHLVASTLVEVDATLAPTGRIIEAAGSLALDADDQPLGDRLDAIPIGEGAGFDHCYVIDRSDGISLADRRVTAPGQKAPAANVAEPRSGRKLSVSTDQPSVQFYTGNALVGPEHRQHGGFCIEAQFPPDAPNHSGFGDILVRPGERYRQRTTYTLGTTTAGVPFGG